MTGFFIRKKITAERFKLQLNVLLQQRPEGCEIQEIANFGWFVAGLGTLLSVPQAS